MRNGSSKKVNMVDNETIDLFINMENKWEKQQYENIHSSESRLVWFVGLAGFGLINSWTLWEKYLGDELDLELIILLSIPYMVSLVLGVVAHLLSGYYLLDMCEYSRTRVGMLGMFKIDFKAKETDSTDFWNLVSDVHPEMKEMVDKLNKYAKVLNILEIVTITTLILGFIWAVI